MYQFDEKKQCSSASVDQFGAMEEEADVLIQPPKLEMKRNVAWAFYSLQEDVNVDFKYFQQKAHILEIVYPRVLTEDHHMKRLETTIKIYYGLHSRCSS